MFDIRANDRQSCASILESQVSDILKICSLIIQSQHDNQNHTHIKLTYDICKIESLSEEDVNSSDINNDRLFYEDDKLSIYDKLSAKICLQIVLDSYDTIKTFMSDSRFKFVLDAHYRALEATDFITKFFNAFSAIEMLETYCITTHKLIEKSHIDEISQYIKSEFNSEISKRICERIKNTLSNATEETRYEKLDAIIKLFGISKLEIGNTFQEINSDFTKKIIDIRNSLFHRKSINESLENDIEEYTPKLIFLLQCILCNWDKLKTG